MPSRNYEYKILISFNTTIENDDILMDELIPYQSSRNYKDRLIIRKSFIELECQRASKVNFATIFSNNNSSLYNQITKSLVCYYCLIKKPIQIQKIEIKNIVRGMVRKTDSLGYKNIIQPITTEFSLKYPIQKQALIESLQENEKSVFLRNCLSHYLVANSKAIEFQKFEKLWKAFNALFRAITSEKSDKEGLIKLREFALQNQNSLEHSNKISGSITFKNLEKLRWRTFISNDFSGRNKSIEFIGFVKRYKDERILSCIKDREFGCQDRVLTAGEKTDLTNHIEKSKNPKLVFDTELTTFLTGKYGYFLRNKNFHGEKIDSEFRLSENKEHNEIKLINNLINAYISDLLNIQ